MGLRGSSGSLDHLVSRLGASMASRSDSGPLSSFHPQGLWSEALTNATAATLLQCLSPSITASAVHSAGFFPEVSSPSNDYDNLPRPWRRTHKTKSSLIALTIRNPSGLTRPNNCFGIRNLPGHWHYQPGSSQAGLPTLHSVGFQTERYRHPTTALTGM